MVGEVVHNDPNLSARMQIPCQTITKYLKATEQSYQTLVTLYRKLQEDYKVVRSNKPAYSEERTVDIESADKSFLCSIV